MTAHEDWKDLLESSTVTKAHDNITEVEVNRLLVNNTYTFRGLFEDDKGQIVLLTSKDITIQGGNDMDYFNKLITFYFMFTYSLYFI